MKNLKVWGKPSITETKVRFAAGGSSGSTTDKGARHASQ